MISSYLDSSVCTSSKEEPNHLYVSSIRRKVKGRVPLQNKAANSTILDSALGMHHIVNVISHKFIHLVQVNFRMRLQKVFELLLVSR